VKTHPRLNPKNDFLFKRLFGEENSKLLLIGLLNAVLGHDGTRRITDLSIIGSTHLSREMIEDKEAILDIHCEIDVGLEQVNVEMQVRPFVRMDHRSLFYTAKLLTSSLHQGQSYSSLKRTIGINILDHRYFPFDKFHSTFHLYEDELRDYLLTDVLELHFIECPKIKNLTFNIHDPLHRWLRFLDQRTTPKQLEELMEVDEIIREAEARLDYLASDEETRRMYAIREKALHDRASWLEDAEQAGMKKGIEQGIEKGIKQGIEQGIEKGIKQGIEQGIEQEVERTALAMLDKGFAISTISEITGLTDGQISQLQHSKPSDS